MLNIRIKTIPHQQQRYETCGDYQTGQDGSIEFRISALSDWRREMLIAVHELVEKAWAMHHQVSDQEIDDFDMMYERQRAEGDESEPGDSPVCPVFAGHQFATHVEKQLAEILDVNWAAYSLEINALSKNDPVRECSLCKRPIFENETYLSCPPLPDAVARRSYHTGCAR